MKFVYGEGELDYMSYNIKSGLYTLLMSIFILLVILIFIILGKKQQPEGVYITKDEILTLVELLNLVIEDDGISIVDEGGEDTGTEDANIKDESIMTSKDVIADLQELVSGWEAEGYVTYGQFLQWEEIAAGNWDVLSLEDKKEMSKKYGKSFYITKQDWFHYFDKLCEVIDPEGKITTEELFVLGDSTNVVDVEGNPIEENQVLTQNGKWVMRLGEKFIPMQRKGFYLTYQDAIWAVYYVEEAATLFNAWIVDNTENELIYFYNNYKVTTTKSEILDSLEREQVTDLQFVLGELQNLVLKKEKITGKVLKISEEEIEIEGQGIYPLGENVQYYRLYDRLENVGRGEVRLGYDYTDFVVENNQIQAALLVKDEKMQNIRVLIKNSKFDGYYHDKIEGKANVDMELIYGTEKLEIPAGERFAIDSDSRYFSSNRIYLKPKALTGRTVFTNIERNNGGQGYYGYFELEKREEGILLINEVLLEEYLYAVVPSEMPGYYPLEALKAQAVSARTYAYNKMIHVGLSSYGAHLDDSSTYQVYNNIKENTNTTTAVKETRGKLLYSGDSLAQTYYYSTSCGYGTDDAIWNERNIYPYLRSKEMSTSNSSHALEELQTEEGFQKFISKVNPDHFEASEGWYRWTYEHQNMEKVGEKLVSRLENYPKYVFTSFDGENWSNQPLEKGFVITDIQVKRRGAGGTIEELLIDTDKGTFLVKNEYHIRAVLADGEAKAELQNDNTYACGNLLPSSFFVLETITKDGQVTGIRLTGGGFGHGVGMSQNGAKNLANLGYTAEDIMGFYYEGCEVRE